MAVEFNRLDAEKLMDKGLKVTHKFFNYNEWVTKQDGDMLFEDGHTCSPDEFWKYRRTSEWYSGWSVYEEK